MTWTETTEYAPDLRLVVEIPTGLPDQARAAMQRHLTAWIEQRTSALVLDHGARIRSIDAAGRVTPSDEIVVRIRWWAFVLGAAVGGLVGGLTSALVGALS